MFPGTVTVFFLSHFFLFFLFSWPFVYGEIIYPWKPSYLNNLSMMVENPKGQPKSFMDRSSWFWKGVYEIWLYCGQHAFLNPTRTCVKITTLSPCKYPKLPQSMFNPQNWPETRCEADQCHLNKLAKILLQFWLLKAFMSI